MPPAESSSPSSRPPTNVLTRSWRWLRAYVQWVVPQLRQTFEFLWYVEPRHGVLRRSARVGACALLMLAMIVPVLLCRPFLARHRRTSRYLRAVDASMRRRWAVCPRDAVDWLHDRFDEAQTRCERSDFDMHSLMVSSSLGSWLYELERQLGRPDRALRVLERQHGVEPGYPDAAIRRAECLVDLDRRAEAIAALEESLPRERAGGPAHQRLADLRS